ncbi:type I-F CRISPR-associated protein Csy3 [Limnohabitans sp. G3-2]|uniref:type I-F CRISPR-associated protein Csy3 n=1 Tax=Limnohabitans sp. G3-2 TaxID=1100711 RepID=UPI000C1DF668|nr:type I-F CRISPR-associated protein Csy3 [Limnohabitans sp. G3-2]PIT76878.1 type I-F CRISPR-associated protein Csy3 [Limnohabitans sp. G3-2]
MAKKASKPAWDITPPVLAFERKLDPSDGIFYAGRWNDRANESLWQAIKVTEKSIRGTISNDLQTKDHDPAELDADIGNPNLQTVDESRLPPNLDTLRVQFSMRILPGFAHPSACNILSYESRLKEIVTDYINNFGLKVLASRYAQNLANGRFLWRNRMGAENVEVRVAHMVDGKAKESWMFDALKTSLCDFSGSNNKGGDVQPLAALIENGLSGQQHVLLHITAFVRVGVGQEVYPSQELILSGQERTLSDGKKARKGKTLYKVADTAALHSQKIGNAIRTIDNWYQGADITSPIAVEPYGSVTNKSFAYRKPTETNDDFYTLLGKWMCGKELSDEQKNFVIAVLIRGGVFSRAKGKKSSESNGQNAED